MKTRKYTLKARTLVGGEWLDEGEVVELTQDQIERLEKSAATESENDIEESAS